MPETADIIKENDALRQQLTTENLTYWRQLEVYLQQDPRLQDSATFQAFVQVQLRAVLAAQQRGQSAAAYYRGDPLAAAQRLMRRRRERPWWWTRDLWFPLGLFVIAWVLPTVILPAIPLQPLTIAAQLGLLVVAVALGIGVTPHLHAHGRLLVWGLLTVILFGAMTWVGRLLPAVGLVYLTRKGGSLVLLGFAVVVTLLIRRDQRRQPLSWLPALVADLWLMTLLALLARLAPTAGLMATTTGTWLIGLGTLLGVVSILISGGHIWRQRQAAHRSTDE